MQKVIKDPQAILTYGWDWADGGSNDGSATDTGWLQGEVISTSSWTITGQDALLIQDSDSNSTTETTVQLSGGTLRRSYTVTNHITTASGLADDRSLIVRIEDK